MPTESNETSQSVSPQQISPIRQLNKLKRFLSTLYHFGLDISDEIGEHVRSLILALVNNALSVEEFHNKIQSTTNFPLRPFAMPFLKSTLPLLQKDLAHLARQSKQSTSHYVAQHEELILLPREALETSASPAVSQNKDSIQENNKRKLAEEIYAFDDRPYATKRTSLGQLHTSSRPALSTNPMTSTPSIRRDKERVFSAYLRDYGTDFKEINSKTIDDEWKNAENMLNCILEMVSKTKRVLFVLQQKDNQLRRLIDNQNLEWRRRQAELVAQTEDRIVEVRRKAEETVLEMKRQSLIDLQKALSQNEHKSNELLNREREQYQRLNKDLKIQTIDAAYVAFSRQEDGPEQCWHCGRKAIETCSGCNFARYCGQYCQHRDWDFHQKVCGADLKRKWMENPQCCRRSTMKQLVRTHSKDGLPQRSSSATTPFINISSPAIALTNSVAPTTDDDEQQSTKNCETRAVKNEHL